MRTLQATLESISANFAKKVPLDKQEVMGRTTEALAATGQAERAIGVGATAPSFEIPDSTGAVVRSSELLAKGPLVLTFFRGHW